MAQFANFGSMHSPMTTISGCTMTRGEGRKRIILFETTSQYQKRMVMVQSYQISCEGHNFVRLCKIEYACVDLMQPVVRRIHVFSRRTNLPSRLKLQRNPAIAPLFR
mmetsp:Transcript_28/g.66  ORF Transcript_28/g.66 Transcript_28/m.66 type:complete len:107 (-) Transcript_28:521-841(-)